VRPVSRHSRCDRSRMPSLRRLVLRWTRADGNRFYDFDGLGAVESKCDPEEWEEIIAVADAIAFPPLAMWAVAAAGSNGSPIVLVLHALWKALRQELAWLIRPPGKVSS